MRNLLLPVGERRTSSWEAHQHRNPRSSEPGTDFYCPIGTPVYAPADGRVYGWGDSIIPATGRWVGLDLTNGQRFRAMHFSRIVLSKSILNNRGFVRKGQLIAYSGASGYGDEDWSWNPNTGGSHTHVTLWPTWDSRYGYQLNGKPYTIDFMKYADTSGSGGGVTPKPEPTLERDEDEMKFLYIDSDGNGKKCWVLLNVNTAKIIWTYEQSKANGWALVWGSARTTPDGKPIPRQEFLNAVDAIQKTS